MKTLIISVGLLFLTIAATTSNKGLETAKIADKADDGYGSYEVNLKMILTNANGQKSTREMSTKMLEVNNDGDKSLIAFKSPNDVKGTAILTYTHKKTVDDQWLFLPSINRVKRISSSNKSGPFMGSEISYEDLSSQEVEKYTYKYLKETTINGAKVAVVVRYPVDLKSGYSKQIVYYNLDKNYRLVKVNYYDKKGGLLKTMYHKNYKKYKSKYWRAGELKIINHQTKKGTRLLFSDFNFDASLSADDFTQNSLKRAGS